jgi:hypothetical protein
MLGRKVWAGVLLVGLVGCDYYDLVDAYWCDHPDKGHKGPDGQPDPCHRQDVDGGADGGEDAGVEVRCESGGYVHWQVGWDEPSWLWIGAEDQAPDCPAGLVSTAYEGRADLVAPTLCEACTCDPPTGSCALPTKLTASTAICYAPGATTSFNAPDPWDGSCDGTTQVAGGAAHSLTIDPIAMTENGCASGPTVSAKVISLRWDTFARACDVVGWSPGPTPRSACVPDDPLPDGFHLCMYQKGISTCPSTTENVFTEQHVFYQGVQDGRQCSTCSCGTPIGSVCKAQVSIYNGNDLTCDGPALEQKGISSEGPVCLGMALAGQALGSKSAGPTVYLPGTCPPMGGDASGAAVAVEPGTFCCRP